MPGESKTAVRIAADEGQESISLATASESGANEFTRDTQVSLSAHDLFSWKAESEN